MPPPDVGAPAPPGIHVSFLKGDDQGSGTEGRPFKTLAAGLAAAKAQGLRLLACAEEYPENVVALDGVSMYGYYDCSLMPWQRIAKRATVRAPSTPAFRIADVTQQTRIEGFEVFAPDLDGTPTTNTAAASIALEVRNAKAVTIGDVIFHAGKGSPGADGMDGPLNRAMNAVAASAAQPQNYRTCDPSVMLGCDAKFVPGVAGGTTGCQLGDPGGPGGAGGYGRWWVNRTTESTASYDPRGFPFAATATTAKGGANNAADGRAAGLPGAPGAQGADGQDGKNGVWKLTAMGFERGNGTAGTPGASGQGGGGGGGTRLAADSAGNLGNPPVGSSYFATATGAGGDAGGCAGQPGTPATGGGASIAALVIDSDIALQSVDLQASPGGRAGKGNLGRFGLAPTALPGAGYSVAGQIETGAGGTGGYGGNAGASGHGAPGPSIALAFYKKRPTGSTKLTPGNGGEGQPELKGQGHVGGVIGFKTLPAATVDILAEYEIKP